MVPEKHESFFFIGERLNPSGSEAVARALKDSDWEALAGLAGEELRAGAQAVDLNVGMDSRPGGTAGCAERMRRTVAALQNRGIGPLVLDSSSSEVLLAGLEEAQEKIFINSVNGAEKSLNALLPAIARRGVPFIGMAVDEAGVPDSRRHRVRIAEKILARARDWGIPKSQILIDCVALPLRFYPDSLLETLEAVRAVRETFGVRTCLGISNVSFGLSQRSQTNADFLSRALSYGLDAGLLNPFERPVMKVLEQYHAVNG